jgi:hypothetical protein
MERETIVFDIKDIEQVSRHIGEAGKHLRALTDLIIHKQELEELDVAASELLAAIKLLSEASAKGVR